MSTKKTLQWADQSMPWHKLESLIHAYPELAGQSSCRTLVYFTESYQGWAQLLSSVLERFCHHECADPRDKVYGLLAIARDNLGVFVDYSMDVRTVFAITALCLFDASSSARYESTYITFSEWTRAVAHLRVQMLPHQPFDSVAFTKVAPSCEYSWRRQVELSKKEPNQGVAMMCRIFNVRSHDRMT